MVSSLVLDVTTFSSTLETSGASYPFEDKSGEVTSAQVLESVIQASSAFVVSTVSSPLVS